MKTEVCTLAIAALLLIGCNAKLISYPDAADPCILVQMNAKFTLSSVNNSMKTEAVFEDAVIGTGHCAQPPESMAKLDLTLNSGVKGNLDLTFMKGSDSTVTMDVVLTFTPDAIFKNGDSVPVVATSSTVKLSKDTASYTCTGNKDIMFNRVNGTKDQYDFDMVISNVQIQAFNVNGTSFSPAEDCTDADVSSQAPPQSTEPPKQTTQSQNDTTTEPTKPSNETTTEPAKNETTTVQPTTEPAKNVTTEPAPQTTTPMPGPSTPKPGSPDTNTYDAKYSNGTCLLFKAGIEFVVPYMMKDKNSTKTIGIPKGNETSFEGNCDAGKNTQTLTVMFYKTWKMMMQFTLDGSDFYLSEIELDADLTQDLFPDIIKPGRVSVMQNFTNSQFAASKDGSYKCNGDSKVAMQNGFEMHTYNLQYTAFQKNTTEFLDTGVSECSSDTDTNSVVPIAVGAALAGLVVIVLIAYLIGRKRSRQSGYEQV